MSTTIQIGFSPCPNDTFIFDAMVHQKIDTKGYNFEYVLEDVETLNEWALEGKLPITKLSYHAYLFTADQYIIADSGSALGRGVGPLLIAKEPLADGQSIEDFIKNEKVALPGEYTTAHLLFKSAFPNHEEKEFLVFSDIEKRILDGSLKAGVIIHENRFTYQDRGLHKLIDLGDWWEQNTQQYIPLGGIAISRDLPPNVREDINQLIKESVKYAYEQHPEIANFVKEHAQEMETEVMKKHINLYVNEHSESLGKEGRAAIDYIFDLAQEKEWVSARPEELYML